MDDLISATLVIILIVVIIAFLYATNVISLDILFGKSGGFCYYTYTKIGGNGPASWKERFPESQGKSQSPINISSCYAIVVCSETIPSLAFSPEYSAHPQEMRAYNDGHTVTLYACWCDHSCPKICGGCLPSEYQFLNIRFRWGPNDEEGSEHTINCRRYSMELQASFVKTDKLYNNLVDAVEQNALLVISYLYEAGRTDNPYLRSITNCLNKIKVPYDYYNIDPIPLSCLMPTFTSKYYMYHGSLSFPPCSEGVIWIVQSEPLAISRSQINKFRNLCSNEGPMDMNTRPIQDVCGREIFFYD